MRHDETEQTFVIPAGPPFLSSGLHMRHAGPAHRSMFVHEQQDDKRLIRLLSVHDRGDDRDWS